jgi:NAD(P)-dependent dehydrogenase (short-subunit alcohol dehydrogenase family)
MDSQRGIPLQSAYCSSKHGIDGFLESLRVELQRDGVPVSVTQMPGTTPRCSTMLAQKMGVKPVAPPPAYPARVATGPARRGVTGIGPATGTRPTPG